jgi:predicted transcriptional regulator of viral defense system
MSTFNIQDIIRLPNTVFSFKELVLTSRTENPELLRRRLHHYTKKGQLRALRRGIYAKDINYNKFELATKILTPSYISFETVLAQAGMIFQYYEQIFLASYLTREIEVDGHKLGYKRVKDAILTNSLGIEQSGLFAIASPERAFLDTIYLYKEYYFDNLSSLNWEKVSQLLPIYGGNIRMIKQVKEYKKSWR